MSVAEKKEFVLKHIFTNAWGVRQHQVYHGSAERHFNVQWRINIYAYYGHFTISLECMKARGENEWSIETEIDMKINSESEEKSIANNHTFSSHVCSQETLKAIKPKEIQNYLVNGSLKLEVRVKIDKMTGMKEKLRDFDESAKEFSDVVLNVNGEKFYVCKMFLASHSAYFKSLFLGNFSESDKSEIALKNVNPYDFQNFLELIHGESAVDDDTVEGILDLADKFDSKTAIRRCEEFLVEKSKKPLKIKFEAAIKSRMNKLKKKCLTEMETEFDIRSVLPEDVYQFDQSVWADLLLKALSLKSSS